MSGLNLGIIKNAPIPRVSIERQRTFDRATERVERAERRAAESLSKLECERDALKARAFG